MWNIYENESFLNYQLKLSYKWSLLLSPNSAKISNKALYTCFKWDYKCPRKLTLYCFNNKNAKLSGNFPQMPKSLDQIPFSPAYVSKENKSDWTLSMVLHEVSQAWFSQRPRSNCCWWNLLPVSDCLLFLILKTLPIRIWVSRRESKWKIMILPLMHGGHDMDN